MLIVFIAAVVASGCLSSRGGKLLPAPSGTRPAAAQYNDAGIQAYDLGQRESAKQQFEAAISSSSTLAEAHYNLGMVLWEMGAENEATPHFMKAANLEPGNEVIANSPALRGIQRPSKGFGDTLAPDGHSHSH